MSIFTSRLAKLRRHIREAKADALLVTNFTNVTYLTGFSGDDSYLLVTLDGQTLVSDRRYTIQLAEECPDLELVIREPGQRMLPTVVELILGSGIERLAIEAGSMSVAMHEELAENLLDVSLVALDEPVEALRTVKDKTEIEAIRVAGQQAARAFQAVRALMEAEFTEKELAAELEYQARRFGAKSLSFPPIVAVGHRAALPHANPSGQQVSAAAFTLIDWGANSGLYVSDLTRMVVTGKLSQKFRKIYQVVLDAQLAAIEAIKPGVTCEYVDSVARDIIDAAGYGKHFGHGLGHGLGLDVHEAPRLAQGQDKVRLEAGMVVTVEPGVYLPDWGGIRIEDDVLVTKNGYEVLTDVPKQLDDCTLA